MSDDDIECLKAIVLSIEVIAGLTGNLYCEQQGSVGRKTAAKLDDAGRSAKQALDRLIESRKVPETFHFAEEKS